MVANAMQTARRKKRTNAPVTPTKEEKRKYKNVRYVRKRAGL